VKIQDIMSTNWKKNSRKEKNGYKRLQI